METSDSDLIPSVVEILDNINSNNELYSRNNSSFPIEVETIENCVNAILLDLNSIEFEIMLYLNNTKLLKINKFLSPSHNYLISYLEALKLLLTSCISYVNIDTISIDTFSQLAWLNDYRIMFIQEMYNYLNYQEED